jgi:Zn ribbon nucleic-acid-binding protein
MDTACKHPKVRVVAREEDVEYVECLDCGQVFDSNEFRDMEIEEEVEQEPEEDINSVRDPPGSLLAVKIAGWSLHVAAGPLSPEAAALFLCPEASAS